MNTIYVYLGFIHIIEKPKRKFIKKTKKLFKSPYNSGSQPYYNHSGSLKTNAWCPWMFSRFMVVTMSLYIYIWNHYVIQMKLIWVNYISEKKEEKETTEFSLSLSAWTGKNKFPLLKSTTTELTLGALLPNMLILQTPDISVSLQFSTSPKHFYLCISATTLQQGNFSAPSPLYQNPS